MAIRLDCPRCKQPLAVPSKKAGSYERCPNCQGRFWVPEDAPADAAQVESVTAGQARQSAPAGPPSPAQPGPGLPPGGVATPPIAHAPPPAAPPPPPTAPAPPPAGQRTSRRSRADGQPGGPATTSCTAPVGAAPMPPAPSATPAALPSAASAPWTAASAPGQVRPPVPTPPGTPAPGPRKARFVSPETADSKLHVAEDGKLPELRLREGKDEDKTAAKSRSLSPLALFALVAVSVGLSIGLVLYEPGSGASAGSELKARARQVLEDEFFGSLNPNAPLERYQVLLRQAQRDYARGDRQAERERYREVLDMLRAERGPAERGLTGSRDRDGQLEKQLIILLGD